MPSSKVRIRCYNVGFGDCILVSFKDGPSKRHILIDFGNAPGKGSSNKPFKAIAQNIKKDDQLLISYG